MKVTENRSIKWMYNIAVKDLIVQLENYIEEYGEDVVIYSKCIGYDGLDEFFLSFKRDETTAEREKRLNEASKNLERKDITEAKKEERDRKEYERLKIQYD